MPEILMENSVKKLKRKQFNFSLRLPLHPPSVILSAAPPSVILSAALRLQPKGEVEERGEIR
jgi:hypothetical protein